MSRPQKKSNSTLGHQKLLLWEQVPLVLCRHTALPGPAPPFRRAPEPDAPLDFLGFGFDKSCQPTKKTFVDNNRRLFDSENAFDVLGCQIFFSVLTKKNVHIPSMWLNFLNCVPLAARPDLSLVCPCFRFDKSGNIHENALHEYVESMIPTYHMRVGSRSPAERPGGVA